MPFRGRMLQCQELTQSDLLDLAVECMRLLPQTLMLTSSEMFHLLTVTVAAMVIATLHTLLESKWPTSTLSPL